TSRRLFLESSRADVPCSGLSRVVHSPPLRFDEGFSLLQGDQPLFVPRALKMTDRNFLAFFPELLSARYLETLLIFVIPRMHLVAKSGKKRFPQLLIPEKHIVDWQYFKKRFAM